MMIQLMLCLVLPMCISAKPLPIYYECPRGFWCHPDTWKVESRNKHISYIPHLPRWTNILKFENKNLTSVNRNTFHNVSSLILSDISLSNNQIQFIAANTFESFDLLKSLDLSNNPSIGEKLSPLISALRNSNLNRLVVQWTNFKLTNEVVLSLKKSRIQHIDLLGNRLNELHQNQMKAFTNMITLILEDCSISKIESTTILTQVEYLYLAQNMLVEFPKVCSPSLQLLDLRYNRLSHMGDYVYRCYSHLQELRLGGNLFIHIPDNFIAGFASLNTLSIYTDRFPLTFSPLAFNSLSLLHLHMAVFVENADFFSKNEFTNIFHLCRQLQHLDMRGINLSTITNERIDLMFKGLSNVKTLILENTSLPFIPYKLFTNMPKLQTLSLRKNKITGWFNDTFAHASSLEYLYLDDNMIRSFNKTSLPSKVLDTISELHLHNNEFNCSCENRWFIRDFTQSGSAKKLSKFPQGFVCETPRKWKGKRLVSYPFNCTTKPSSMAPSVVMGCIAIVYLVMLLSVYKYRWHIKYYIYLFRAKRNSYKSIDKGKYIYDAFVAYAHEDKVWVISELIPHLENNQRLKLCLHDRDFVIGKLIVDNICDKIQQSRTTIVVLSDAFAASVWCRYEMALAQTRHIDNNDDSMILVMLKDIKDVNMTGSLCVLLDSTTYIPWENKKRFWKRLIKSVKKA